MVYEENNKYFRTCDDCNNTIEIQRQTYLKNIKKDKHYCNSCRQKGSRNHRFNKDPWNKGLTKETDERIKKYGEKCSQTKQGYIPWNKDHTYEELKGEEWAKNFKEKVSKVKIGKPNFKRRVPMNRERTYGQIIKTCRMLLYTEWKRKVLERDSFKCVECGSKKDLEVHHVRSFRKIVRIVAKRMGIDIDNFKNISDEEYDVFRKELVKEHKLEDGITLCKECHMKIDEYRRLFNEKNVCRN